MSKLTEEQKELVRELMLCRFYDDYYREKMCLIPLNKDLMYKYDDNFIRFKALEKQLGLNDE